jgi:hypothetical protein
MDELSPPRPTPLGRKPNFGSEPVKSWHWGADKDVVELIRRLQDDTRPEAAAHAVLTYLRTYISRSVQKGKPQS